MTSPICNASRVAILTGRYQQRVGQVWYGGPGIARDQSPTMAELFRQAGYRTAMVGKVHHGSLDKVDNRNHPLRHGYDSFFGFLNSTKHYLKHAKQFEGPGLSILAMGPMMRDDKPIDIEGYSTEMFGEEARRNRQRRRRPPVLSPPELQRRPQLHLPASAGVPGRERNPALRRLRSQKGIAEGMAKPAQLPEQRQRPRLLPGSASLFGS